MNEQRVRRIDLHVHSSFSDGTLSPEQLAAELAASSCSHVSLTDHNTSAGWERFREAAERNGLHAIWGTELDAHASCGPIHLLAYGCDPHNGAMQRMMRALRHPWGPFATTTGRRSEIRRIAPGTGSVEAGSAIQRVHHAGGSVFLAHPRTISGDWQRLEQAIVDLQALGLDGIEAHYKSYDRDTRARLCEMAAKHGLLISAGSDYHGPGVSLGAPTPGYDTPETVWRPLANSLGAGDNLSIRTTTGTGLPPRRLRRFLLHIGLPAALAGLLFVLTLFFVFLPAIEKQLLERKKETIRELTRTAASILQEYHSEALAGLMSVEQAQRESVERVSRMRYGEEGKDYFWITDTHPTMVMHPYRSDLNGQDLSQFRDKAGNLVFVTFVEAVREDDAGYVNYYWQWKDDPDQIVPKLSYLQAFRPWGWVIGTGIYTEDLKAEITGIKNRLVLASLLISAVVALLLLRVAQQSYLLERRRARAEEELSLSNEKYRTLVEASTEGTMMVLNGECAYANAPLEEMLGYGPGEIGGRCITELFCSESTLDRSAIEHVQALLAQDPAPSSFRARMCAKDNPPLDVLLMVTPVQFENTHGMILIVRDTRSHLQVEDALARSRDHYRKLTQRMPLGVFRSLWHENHTTLIEANTAMLGLLGASPESDLRSLDWLEMIAEDTQRRRVYDTLSHKESVEQESLTLRREDGTLVDVRLFAVLVQEEDRCLCDGILEDITQRTRQDAGRDALITQLQTSLFFLQEPVSRVMRDAPTLSLNESVLTALSLLTRTSSPALFVTDDKMHVLGVITNQDLCTRVLKVGADSSLPLRKAMSAPVCSLSPHALVSEALTQMEEYDISQLAVVNEDDRLLGTVHMKDLVRFRQTSTIVQAGRIAKAQSASELHDVVEELPQLVQAMLSSGVRVRPLCRIISNTADKVAARLLTLAQNKLGPAPCPFALVAMGSQARQEQTLLTDQDTGLIYAKPPRELMDAWSAYFLRLGSYVTQGLVQAGYPECPGGVMASRTMWNQCIDDWITAFGMRIQHSSAEDLLDFNISFDLRCITGDRILVQQLKDAVFEMVEPNPSFLLHMARNASLSKPPIGVRGNIVTHSNSKGEKCISLKEALLPVVNYGRLYALKHCIQDTHTLDRLGELQRLGGLSSSGYEELQVDYEAIMHMRLRRQVDALFSGRAPGNDIGPEDWTDYEESMLKRLFGLHGDLRKKIGYDFLGGMV